jgi:hypothetical protein
MLLKPKMSVRGGTFVRRSDKCAANLVQRVP